jgi:hypothetical protein
MRIGMFVVFALFLSNCGLDLQGYALEDVSHADDVTATDDTISPEAEPESAEFNFDLKQDDNKRDDVDVEVEAETIPEIADAPDLVEDPVSDDTDQTDQDDTDQVEVIPETETDAESIPEVADALDLTEDLLLDYVDSTDSTESISEITEEEDPCSLPTVSNPMFLFFCLPGNTEDKTMWRWVDRLSGDLPWGEEPGCTVTGSHQLACVVADYGPGTDVYFDIAIGSGWACGEAGLLKVWYYRGELTVNTVENSQANTAAESGSYDFGSAQWAFQPFLTGLGAPGMSASEVRSVRIYVAGTVGNPGNLTVGIRATDTNYPIGGDLTSAFKTQAEIVTGWNSFDFATTVTLAPATQYAIVVRSSGGSFPANHYSLSYSAPVYGGGRAGWSNNSAATWHYLTPDSDFLFRVIQGCDFKVTLPTTL